MSETVSETHAAVPSAYPPSSEFAAQANATEDLYRGRRVRGGLIRAVISQAWTRIP